MPRCPRCLIEFDDGSKICRFCGGILEDIAELPALDPRARPTSPSRSPTLDSEIAIDDWRCASCQETVPGTFTVCWNCGSDRNVIVESALSRPDDSTVVGSAREAQSEPKASANSAAMCRCAACGSEKIIPQVLVNDQGQGSRGQLRVVVYGKPDAILFKDACYGPLTANICGKCGRVQLYVNNANELYEHYLESKQGTAAVDGD